MPAGSASGGGLRLIRIQVKTAPCPQPGNDADLDASQSLGQLNRNIAGIDGKYGAAPPRQTLLQQRLNLRTGSGVDVCQRLLALHPHRGSPTVMVQMNVGHPLIGLASHNRLPVAMAMRMLVEPPLGAGLSRHTAVGP
jgi:hypothetical protein